MGRLNQQRKSRQFRANLRALIRHEGWTQRAASTHLGIAYPRLRKYLGTGVANLTDFNRPDLERICKRLRVSDVAFLWATRLKPQRPPRHDDDAELRSLIYQLEQLLNDEFRETTAVKKIIAAIDAAFSLLVCGITEAKERARGRSFVDNDTSRRIVRRNRRLGGGRKKKEDDERH